MRVGGETVGPRGIALLAVAAAVGLALAVHGWLSRHDGLPSTLAGPRPSASAAVSPTSAPASASAPAQGPTAAASPAPTPGPKLSAQSFAAYSFQVWPGTPTPAAASAETGLVIHVHKHGSGILVAAGVAGQPLPAATFYPSGARVYVIEASMGDDSGSADYNLGDDGLAVTDASGRILQ